MLIILLVNSIEIDSKDSDSKLEILLSSNCIHIKVIRACINSLKKKNADIKKANSGLKLKYYNSKCNSDIKAMQIESLKEVKKDKASKLRNL